MTDSTDHSHSRLASQDMGLNDKVALLESIGRKDLIDIFKGYSRKRVAKPKAAPLDQRISVSVSSIERIDLTNTMKELMTNGSAQSVSAYIRSKAIQTIDLQEWKDIALKELARLKKTEESKKELKSARLDIISSIEGADVDGDELYALERKLIDIDSQLKLLIAQPAKRSSRLNGRMTMKEAEIVRWRSQRLCLTVSDYLRMMLFDWAPAGVSDAHLSKESRERFYVSIVDVCDNGWGSPGKSYSCSQCVRYVEEIDKLKAETERLRAMLR